MGTAMAARRLTSKATCSSVAAVMAMAEAPFASLFTYPRPTGFYLTPRQRVRVARAEDSAWGELGGPGDSGGRALVPGAFCLAAVGRALVPADRRTWLSGGRWQRGLLSAFSAAGAWPVVTAWGTPGLGGAD